MWQGGGSTSVQLDGPEELAEERVVTGEKMTEMLGETGLSGGEDDDGGSEEGDCPWQVDAEGELENELPVYGHVIDINVLVKQDVEALRKK